MPKPVIRYVCQFGCGHKATYKHVIEQHERCCAKDPNQKSCVTCKHGITEIADNGDQHPHHDGECQSWMVRKCAISSPCFHSEGHFKVDILGMEQYPENICGVGGCVEPNPLYVKCVENPAAITYHCDDWEGKK